jgi:hypothetical protein
VATIDRRHGNLTDHRHNRSACRSVSDRPQGTTLSGARGAARADSNPAVELDDFATATQCLTEQRRNRSASRLSVDEDDVLVLGAVCVRPRERSDRIWSG